MSQMPMPAYFLFPFETMWTRARKGTLHVGDTAPGLTVQTLDTQQPQAYGQSSGFPVPCSLLWVAALFSK